MRLVLKMCSLRYLTFSSAVYYMRLFWEPNVKGEFQTILSLGFYNMRRGFLRRNTMIHDCRTRKNFNGVL